MTREPEMVIEGSPFRIFYVASVGVIAEVGRWLALSYILRVAAQGAVRQVDYVSTLTVQVVEYLQFLAGGVASELLG